MGNNCTREIFLKVMNFEPCKRTIKWEFGYWVGALDRWYKEGLPKIRGFKNGLGYGDGLIGPGHPAGSPSWSGEIPEPEIDVNTYFNFDERWALTPYNYWIFPKFEKIVLFEDDTYLECRDVDGITKRTLKDNSSMPMFLEFPVKNRRDWEEIKEERLNFESIDKRFLGSMADFIKWSRNRTCPLSIFDDPVGFFGSLRLLIGENSLFLLYYDDPVLIKDILQHLSKMWLLMAEKLTSEVEFDSAVFWEDMSGKNGPLISPGTFKEFMTPCYKKITDFLKTKKIKYFNVDSDGNVSNLIPLFLEAGLNSMYPFEQQAGNDMLELRKKFPQLRMIGGIDKNILYKGREYIEKELQKVPALIKQGGYIPYIDHMVPPNSSWENFKYYRNKLNNIIDNTGVLS
jgi:hypothetical protein